MQLVPGAAQQPSEAQQLAPVIVRAVRFVMEKTRELRSDTALARLNMLRGRSQALCMFVGTRLCCT